MIEMNQNQVKKLLQYIDSTQTEDIKEDIFCRLGYECLYATEGCNWIKSFGGDVQKFLDGVNVEHKSSYWESLVYNDDKSALILTGRPMEGCVCSFADGVNTPMALCNYCCKNFQQEMFKLLFGRDVEVEITASCLKGDDRCSSIIRII